MAIAGTDSRYVLLFPLLDGFTAERMQAALTAAVGRLPWELRPLADLRSGPEMAEHTQLVVDSGV